MTASRADGAADTGPVVTGHVDGHGIAWITLDRPNRMNAITVALARQLERAVCDAAGAARVAVIRGSGGNFCAGGDLDEVARLRADGAEALAGLFDAFGRACDAVGTVDIPVVAAVEGRAMAGGFELAQACDVVLVSDTATLCDNHVNVGALPGGGGSQRLPRLVGRSRALAHMLSGQPLTGREAVDWGLAFRCWPAAEFEAAVASFARQLAGRPPAALSGIKRLVRDGLSMPLDDGLAMERSAIVAHLIGEAGNDFERAVENRRSP